MEKTTRNLSFVLTDDETRDRGRELAKSLKMLDDVETEKAEASKNFKESIEHLTRECERLTRVLNSGTEDRPVECTWVRDNERGLMRLVRDDNEMVVESRPMTDDERQGRFVE